MARHLDLLFSRTLPPSIQQTRETYRAAISLVAGLIFVVCLFLAGQKPRSPSPATISSPPPILRAAEPAANDSRMDLPPDDPSQSYALIPTGVSSAHELRIAMANDSALRWHYANFNLKRAVLRVLVKDEPAYVSYRKDSEIRWTKHTVVIHKGEFVLDDGARQIRARCGNRIEPPEIAAETPILPGDLEPPSPFLIPPPETPETPVIPPPPTRVYIPPAAPPPPPTTCCPFPIVPPIYIPPGGGPPPTTPPTPPGPPRRAPEPPTIFIFAGAAFACVLLRKLRPLQSLPSRHNRDNRP